MDLYIRLKLAEGMQPQPS